MQNYKLKFKILLMVGVLGIEPRPHTPKACVLPLYYTPFQLFQYIFFASRGQDYFIFLIVV